MPAIMSSSDARGTRSIRGWVGGVAEARDKCAFSLFWNSTRRYFAQRCERLRVVKAGVWLVCILERQRAWQKQMKAPKWVSGPADWLPITHPCYRSINPCCRSTNPCCRSINLGHQWTNTQAAEELVTAWYMSESPALNMLALLQYLPSNIFPPTSHQQLNKKDGYTIGYGPQVKLAKK